MSIIVRPDDLSSPQVQALVTEHLAGMHGNTPAGHVHALALDSLRAPGITFWSAWLDGQLCGCGALKALGDHAGEIKSMRTRPAFLRRGVGQAVLDEIFRVARDIVMVGPFFSIYNALRSFDYNKCIWFTRKLVRYYCCSCRSICSIYRFVSDL